MNCAICLTEMVPVFNWTYLFSKEPEFEVCTQCKNQLLFIEGERCQICSRPLKSLEISFIQDGICLDCIRWEKDPDWKGVLDSNQSLFLYNDFLKDTIAQYKYRGDQQIAAAFATFLPKKFFKNKVVMPIPLSDERLYERGFNQAEAILQYGNIPYQACLTRVHSEKQSKKTRQQRLQQETLFSIKAKEGIDAQNILLFDDIYTTGATLRNAAKRLKDAGALSVTSFTIAR